MCYATLHPALLVGRPVCLSHFTSFMIFMFGPHRSCLNGLVTLNMALAHPHATLVAVYPAFFCFNFPLFFFLDFSLSFSFSFFPFFFLFFFFFYLFFLFFCITEAFTGPTGARASYLRWGDPPLAGPASTDCIWLAVFIALLHCCFKVVRSEQGHI